MIAFLADLAFGWAVLTALGVGFLVGVACTWACAKSWVRQADKGLRAEYRRGRQAGLEAAQRFRHVTGQSRKAVERAVMAERN